MRAEIDKRAMAALASGHAATDFANGALPALLPFFVDRFDLSYTLAALLILASAFSSSVIQPFFGLWSDRRGAIWLLPTGVAVAGLGIALAAIAPRYWLVLLFVLISGVRSPHYHPEGSRFAAYTSGRRRASGMSLFSIGGNLGYAARPGHPQRRSSSGWGCAAGSCSQFRALSSRPCWSPPRPLPRERSLPADRDREAWPARTGPAPSFSCSE